MIEGIGFDYEDRAAENQCRRDMADSLPSVSSFEKTPDGFFINQLGQICRLVRHPGEHSRVIYFTLEVNKTDFPLGESNAVLDGRIHGHLIGAHAFNCKFLRDAVESTERTFAPGHDFGGYLPGTDFRCEEHRGHKGTNGAIKMFYFILVPVEEQEKKQEEKS